MEHATSHGHVVCPVLIRRGALVKICYELLPVSAGESSGRTIDIVIGNGHIVASLEEVLVTMSVHETREVVIPAHKEPDLAFALKLNLSAEIRFRIELLAVSHLPTFETFDQFLAETEVTLQNLATTTTTTKGIFNVTKTFEMVEAKRIGREHDVLHHLLVLGQLPRWRDRELMPPSQLESKDSNQPEVCEGLTWECACEIEGRYCCGYSTNKTDINVVKLLPNFNTSGCSAAPIVIILSNNNNNSEKPDGGFKEVEESDIEVMSINSVSMNVKVVQCRWLDRAPPTGRMWTDLWGAISRHLQDSRPVVIIEQRLPIVETSSHLVGSGTANCNRETPPSPHLTTRNRTGALLLYISLYHQILKSVVDRDSSSLTSLSNVGEGLLALASPVNSKTDVDLFTRISVVDTLYRLVQSLQCSAYMITQGQFKFAYRHSRESVQSLVDSV